MTTTTSSAFLSGGGAMGARVRAFDWASTPLGPIAAWPAVLRIMVETILSSRFPHVLFWGPELISIYNDAYAPMLGNKPESLGRSFPDIWSEIWGDLSPVVDTVLAGESAFFEDMRLVIDRHGYAEETFFTFCYSPLRDENGKVVGVLDTAMETTDKVRGEQVTRQERQRFVQLFDQAPSFIAVLRGPSFVYEYANSAYLRLIGDRDLIGREVIEAVPDADGQGFFELLDGVYETGIAFTARGMKLDVRPVGGGPLETRYLDFVYQPIRNADGVIDGIFVEGVDVTNRMQAERRDRVMNSLTDRLRDSDDPADLAYAASQILGEALNVSRIGFGTVDVAAQSYTAEPAWTAPGLVVPPDTMSLRPFGTYIDRLARGEVVRIEDSATDEMTRGNIDILQARHAMAFVNVPVIEREGLVAIMYVSSAVAREWSDDDIALIREVAERTRSHVARLRAIAGLRRNEEQLRLATEAGDIGFWDIDMTALTIFLTPNMRGMFGMLPDEAVVLSDFGAAVHPDDRAMNTAAYMAAADPAQRAVYDVEYRAIGRHDGIERWIAVKGRGIFDDKTCVRVIGTAVEITARKRVEQELRELNETLERRVVDQTRERTRTWEVTPEIVGVLNADGFFETSNPAWQTVLGWTETEIRTTKSFDFIHPDDLPRTYAAWNDAALGLPALRFENRFRTTAGDWRWLSWVAVPEGGKVYCSARDITADKEREAALARTEDALRQAQKMEAVGQLTGGIAHDFNNMLAVVMGSLDLLERRIGTDDERARRYVTAASDGARRAANLTKRLLAFSRQQPLQPEVVDVNNLVAGMSDLLTHSLGRAVHLETVLAGGLWRIHADPNQLENVILNLGVNARDAILEANPDGGKVTIETQNIVLDARHFAGEDSTPAGDYVVIAVSDTGTGMPPEVVARAFDPFFTTKAVGKGTGLGLSQVYGFVRQSGGHVRIYSEPGQGTAIKIYLPRHLSGDAVSDISMAGILEGEQSEVILVVDDEDAVRRFSVDALTELGYQVLEANGAAAALLLIETHPEISLLFTDIVMPQTNGRQLADAAVALRPTLRVLYTTGYTRNAVVHNGMVDPGVDLMGKPYTIDDLAAKLRSMLER